MGRDGEKGERRIGEGGRTECTVQTQRKVKGRGREWDQGVLLASIPRLGEAQPRSQQIKQALSLVPAWPVSLDDGWYAQLPGQLPTGNSWDKGFHSEVFFFFKLLFI